MLRLAADVYATMIAHCYDGLPFEACGLLAAAPGTTDVTVCYPCKNVDASSLVYTVDPLDYLRADRDAEARGLEIVAVFHSHTHTPAYPSPTDIRQAPDPEWHYVLVSLAEEAPSTRSYRIDVTGVVTEEPVQVTG